MNFCKNYGIRVSAIGNILLEFKNEKCLKNNSPFLICRKTHVLAFTYTMTLCDIFHLGKLNFRKSAEVNIFVIYCDK